MSFEFSSERKQTTSVAVRKKKIKEKCMHLSHVLPFLSLKMARLFEAGFFGEKVQF